MNDRNCPSPRVTSNIQAALRQQVSFMRLLRSSHRHKLSVRATPVTHGKPGPAIEGLRIKPAKRYHLCQNCNFRLMREQELQGNAFGIDVAERPTCRSVQGQSEMAATCQQLSLSPQLHSSIDLLLLLPLPPLLLTQLLRPRVPTRQQQQRVFPGQLPAVSWKDDCLQL